MKCTVCPDATHIKPFESNLWWDIKKHYKQEHPDVDPNPLFPPEDRNKKIEFEPETLRALHGEHVDIKDNGGNVVGRGTMSYNENNNSIAVTGCRIRGRAL